MSLARVLSLIILFACLLPQPVEAIGLLGGKTASALIRRQSALSQRLALRVDRTILISSRAARFAYNDREGFLNSTYSIPYQSMATLTAMDEMSPALSDPLFSVRNDRLALAWFEPVEKDLFFIKEHRQQMIHDLKVNRFPLQNINYASLIPSDARKIFVGETHNNPLIYKAFEQLVFQYRELYPQRKIIILTEFMSDRLLPWQEPGRIISRFEVKWREQSDSFNFFAKFIQAGIDVIGLEDVMYMQANEGKITESETQAGSVYGMKERNMHWRQIIHDIRQQHPQAILFIYTGTIHSHYRAPYSISTPSAQNFVLQFETAVLGEDIPFGSIMSGEPFTKTNPQQVTVLSWPKQLSMFSTHSGFDTCIIMPEEPS